MSRIPSQCPLSWFPRLLVAAGAKLTKQLAQTLWAADSRGPLALQYQRNFAAPVHSPLRSPIDIPDCSRQRGNLGARGDRASFEWRTGHPHQFRTRNGLLAHHTRNASICCSCNSSPSVRDRTCGSDLVPRTRTIPDPNVCGVGHFFASSHKKIRHEKTSLLPVAHVATRQLASGAIKKSALIDFYQSGYLRPTTLQVAQSGTQHCVMFLE
jgi:hypothetical protein